MTLFVIAWDTLTLVVLAGLGAALAWALDLPIPVAIAAAALGGVCAIIQRECSRHRWFY